MVPLYRKTTDEELQLCPGNWKYGSYFTTLLTECTLYLPWATKKFLENGGKICSGKLNNITDLAYDYDVIFNCTGFGAKYLCNDNKVVPIRGQVLKVII